MNKKHKNIEELLINSDREKAGDICSKFSEDELCDFLKKLSKQRKVQLFMVLGDDLQERVFEKCPADVKVTLLSLLDLPVARRLFIRQSSELQKELLQRLPKGRRKSLFLSR